MAKNIFEKVLENVNIKDVVSKYLEVLPSGKNYKAICPFHDDHSPSMSISEERGIFNCFVCHTGGNAIKFVELYNHISSVEAAKLLARDYHIDLSEFERENKAEDKTNRYYKLMDKASKFYSFLMNESNISKDARDYLYGRGITDEAIKEFSIGLSIGDDEALTKTMIDKGFIESDLSICGLSNDSKDFFTDRIMVPIRDSSGRCVAFGGRIYKKESDGLEKYKNSKETPIFKKGEVVFNIDKAIRELNTTKYLIINEGYMDVITSYSNGIKNAVAIMGTKITDEQVALIKKYTNNVEICLDGDNAGVEGSANLMRAFEKAQINYSVVILPDSMDPDEFIRKRGASAYKEYLENEKLDKISYIYELTRRKYGAINTFNMDTFKNEIFSRIKDEESKSTIERNLIKLSRDLKVSYESIEEDFISFRKGLNKPYKKETQNKKVDQRFEVTPAYKKAEKIVIDYSIKDKSYFDVIERSMGSRLFLRDQNFRKLFIFIGDIYDKYSRTLPIDEMIIKLKELNVYGDYEFDKKYNFSIDDLEKNILNSFRKRDLKEEIDLLNDKIRSNTLEKDELNKLILELQEKRKELKKL